MLHDGTLNKRTALAACTAPFDHQGAPRRRQAPPALGRHAGLNDPRRPASLMHANIVVSLMAGVCPEEARAIGSEVARELDVSPEGHRRGCPGRRWGS